MKRIPFYPNGQKDVRALMQYIESHREEIVQARSNPLYLKDVGVIRERMREYWEKNTLDPKGPSAWSILGTNVECGKLAEKYSVPYWDVMGDANPYDNVV